MIFTDKLNAPIWDRFPTLDDPRLRILGVLSSYVILGITVLGFNRSPAQIFLIVGFACFLDMSLHFLFGGRRLLFPLSAAITGCSLSILTNFSHGLLLPIVPVFFAISSKYLITVKGKHIFNPALFGIVMSLLFAEGSITVSPAYQWGSSIAMAAFVVTAALLLFISKIQRLVLTFSFIGFYTIQLLIRGYLTRDIIPPETLFIGALTAPAFYLFAFFMITDPSTSPSSTKQQVGLAFAIALVDFVLHTRQNLFTFFFAGFFCACVRWSWFYVQEVRVSGLPLRTFLKGMTRWVTILFVGMVTVLLHHTLMGKHEAPNPGFHFAEISTTQSGLMGRPSKILEQVDPRLGHVAKWLLSVGDAVAVADVNNDGLQDVFLTYPLKDAGDRAALYLNRSNFHFERVPIPSLAALAAHPETQGLPSGALWWDYDNDGDQDLLLLVSFGHSRLLQNRLSEDGKLHFRDVSQQLGINPYTISLTANAFDHNRDGKLDLLLANALNPNLSDYAKPTLLNIFRLPDPSFDGDRRMFNFMHRTWHDANNGGQKLLYTNEGTTFRQEPADVFGLGSRRWTLSIGTADLNGDHLTDLYLANDFGPDELLLGGSDGRFLPVRGALVGEVGHDTYKSMNSSMGDIDNDGRADIYVSNVHHPLQAEGSLLWLNRLRGEKLALPSRFQDEATQRNALNEDRFGWGAAMGDLDRDGRLDILQANGMVDASYDPPHKKSSTWRPGALWPAPQFQDPTSKNSCDDFWYWNAQLALTPPEVHGYADRWADLHGRCIYPYEQNRVYLNRGDYFADVAKQVGWTQPGNSRGIALVDLDNDGDLDALVTHQFAPVSLYRNDSEPRTWLGLRLRGNGITCNRDAISTKVIVSSNSGVQVRELSTTNGFSAQGDRRLLFGLGQSTAKVHVSIDWCGSGRPHTQELLLDADRYHTIGQPS